MLIITTVAAVSFSLYSIFTKRGVQLQEQANKQQQIDLQKMDKDNQEALANLKLEEIRKTDSDLDGLSDAEEKKLGTNLKNIDTDSDGLTDKNEVDLKTDPLKADTDGDGLNDGYEVRRGQDPLKK